MTIRTEVCLDCCSPEIVVAADAGDRCEASRRRCTNTGCWIGSETPVLDALVDVLASIDAKAHDPRRRRPDRRQSR